LCHRDHQKDSKNATITIHQSYRQSESWHRSGNSGRQTVKGLSNGPLLSFHSVAAISKEMELINSEVLCVVLPADRTLSGRSDSDVTGRRDPRYLRRPEPWRDRGCRQLHETGVLLLWQPWWRERHYDRCGRAQTTHEAQSRSVSGRRRQSTITQRHGRALQAGVSVRDIDASLIYCNQSNIYTQHVTSNTRWNM